MEFINIEPAYIRGVQEEYRVQGEVGGGKSFNKEAR